MRWRTAHATPTLLLLALCTLASPPLPPRQPAYLGEVGVGPAAEGVFTASLTQQPRPPFVEDRLFGIVLCRVVGHVVSCRVRVRVVPSVAFTVAPAVGVAFLQVDALVLLEAEQQLIFRLHHDAAEKVRVSAPTLRSLQCASASNADARRIETNLVIRDRDGDRGVLLASAHLGPDGVDHIFGLQPDEKSIKKKEITKRKYTVISHLPLGHCLTKRGGKWGHYHGGSEDDVLVRPADVVDGQEHIAGGPAPLDDVRQRELAQLFLLVG